MSLIGLQVRSQTWAVSEAGATRVRGVEAAGHRAGVRAVALAPDDRTLLSLAGNAAKARRQHSVPVVCACRGPSQLMPFLVAAPSHAHPQLAPVQNGWNCLAWGLHLKDEKAFAVTLAKLIIALAIMGPCHLPIGKLSIANWPLP